MKRDRARSLEMPMAAVFDDRQTHAAFRKVQIFRRNGKQMALITNLDLVPCRSFFDFPMLKLGRKSAGSTVDFPH